MRIAFVTYEFPPDTGKGGIGTYTMQVAAMLAAESKWDVHVFAGSQLREGPVFVNGIYVHWIKCSGPHDFRYLVLPIFESLHIEKAFQLIESPEIHGNAVEIKKKYPSLPLLVRLHAPNSLVEGLKKKYYPFTSKLRYSLGALKRGKLDAGYWRAYRKEKDQDYCDIRFANHITAPSGAMKEWAVKNWQLAEADIEVLPNVFIPAVSLLNTVQETAKNETVLFFGRLNVLKGLVNATKAMKVILQRNPAWDFLLVGDDGPGVTAGSSMRRWIENELEGFLGRVRFEPGKPYDEIPAVLGRAGIVLLPSLFESFSYSCAEAMAAGKAVVGSSSTGMAELICHKSTGMLADPLDHSAIAEAVQELITDVELRKRIGENAQKNIVENFSKDKLLHSYHAVYAKVANL